MKKCLAILLMLAVVLSLVACGGDNGGGNGGEVGGSVSAGGQEQNGSTGTTEAGDAQKPQTDVQRPETGGAGTGNGEEKEEQTQEDSKPSVTASHTDVTLFEVGETFRFGIRGIAGAYTATYTSEDENVATVDQNGVVTAVAPGMTTILVRVESGDAETELSCIVRCRWETVADEQPSAGEQPDNSRPDQTIPNNSADLEAFFAQITGTYEFGPLERLTGELLENFYAGISAMELKQSIVTVNMMTMNNGEFGLVEVADSKDADAVKALFQARVDMMVNGGAFYPSAEDQWMNNSRVVSKGSYVMMIIHERCDDIVAAFNSYVD